MRLSPLLLLAVLFVPGAASAQSAEDILGGMKDGILSGDVGCDYAAYMNRIKELKENFTITQGVAIWARNRTYGIPMTDYVSMLMRGASTATAERTAEAENRNLLYQLEQLCQVALQADELNRTRKLVQAGQFNVGNAINFLLDSAAIAITNDDLRKDSARVTVDFQRLYANAAPTSGTNADTLWSAVNGVLEGTMSATNDYLTAIDTIFEQTRRLRRELYLLAERDDLGKWSCPEGYPDPNNVGVQVDEQTGKPICGPASPERSAQVLAHIELLKVQLQTIQMSAEARTLEVDAVGLMSDNQVRQLSLAARMKALGGH